MKLQRGRFTGKEQEVNLVETTMNNLFKKHGFELVRHVSNKMFEDIRKTRLLEKEIKQKEVELKALKQKQDPTTKTSP